MTTSLSINPRDGGVGCGVRSAHRCAVGGDVERLDEGVPVRGCGNGLVKLGERADLLAGRSALSTHVLAGAASHVAVMMGATVGAVVGVQTLARCPTCLASVGAGEVHPLAGRGAGADVGGGHGRSPMSTRTSAG